MNAEASFMKVLELEPDKVEAICGLGDFYNLHG
jgi:hypothetical protein